MAEQPGMSMEELLALPMTFGIKTAARALGLSERKAYELAAARQFPVPVLRHGNTYVFTRPDVFRYFGLDPALVARPVPVARPAPDQADRAQAGAA